MMQVDRRRRPRRKGESFPFGRSNRLMVITSLLVFVALLAWFGDDALQSMRGQRKLKGVVDLGRGTKEGEAGESESHLSGESDEQHREEPVWPQPQPHGWQPDASVRFPHLWHSPIATDARFLLVRCNGGLNQQRAAICNAVVVAHMLNATLVLPELDANDFWNDTSSFSNLYDTDHFIQSLRDDVRIVKELPPEIAESRKDLVVRLRPPRETLPEWYFSEAIPEFLRNAGIYLTPFAHRLSEELTDKEIASLPLRKRQLITEWQRLRCRTNFAALRFRPSIHSLADAVIARLRGAAAASSQASAGRFIAVHLRFEKDMLAFAGCLDIFTPDEQEELMEYRNATFAFKELNYKRRRKIGKCPLTPHEVGLTLRAMGFRNNTIIYLAGGPVFGGDRFMEPLLKLFPLARRRADMATPEEMEEVEGNGRALLGQAVDYLVCVMADVFMPSYDGPSNFANLVLGHRVFLGFRPSLRPDRSALARLLDEWTAGGVTDDVFAPSVRNAVKKHPPAAPFPRRVGHMSFLSDPWPECFCRQEGAASQEDACMRV